MKKLEIERKYIILKPDVSYLLSMPDFTSSRITQTYLLAENGTTHRVRKREYPDRVEYTENKKQRVSKMSVIETEHKITEDEYYRLLEKRDRSCNVIDKTRITFFYKGHTMEVDIYPFWYRHAILEIELTDELELIMIPDKIELVREVTGEKKYSNHSMAKKIPDEH